jgi:hydroxyacyl-ACP dehydratase HTD2-like protein with hotdog domain
VIDRSRIGFTTAPLRVVIDRFHVDLFCRSIGETDPVYLDTAAAKSAGHAACLVPPTFLKALETDHCASASILENLGIPLRAVLHAEQAFEYLAPVHVGDEIELTRTWSEAYDRKGGALTFVVLDSRFLRASSLVATSRQVLVVRNPPAS